MDANTVIASCATVIAVASLMVSVLEARAVRQHNRHSVRPMLELRRTWRTDSEAGIRLLNYGLGPAIITRTVLTLDGKPMGKWNEEDVNRVRDALPIRPHAATFRDGQAIPAGYQAFLLFIKGFDREEHHWFWDLINRRLGLEIHYESLYGGESFKITLADTY